MEIELDRAYRFCYLLHIDIIKNELANIIKGFELISGKKNNGGWEFTFKKDLEQLNLYMTHNEISIYRKGVNYYQFINLNKLMLMQEYKVEKREKGIIYQMIKKQFSQVSVFDNDIILTDLMEDRFILTEEDLIKMIMI